MSFPNLNSNDIFPIFLKVDLVLLKVDTFLARRIDFELPIVHNLNEILESEFFPFFFNLILMKIWRLLRLLNCLYRFIVLPFVCLSFFPNESAEFAECAIFNAHSLDRKHIAEICTWV